MLPKLKIFYKDDIRRVSMISSEYDSLLKQITELFGLNETSFSIKYKDDEGDLITLCNNDDLKEALSNCQNNILRIFVNCKTVQKRKIRKCRKNRKVKQEEPTLKNDFIPILENTLEYIQPFCGQIENIIQNVLYGDIQDNLDSFYTNIQQSFENNNSSISENIENNPPKIIHGAYCDKCDNKIQGNRYKCFDCPDFDFCESCYPTCNGKEDIKTHKKEHVFGKIEDPNNHSSFRQEKEKYFEMKQLEKLEKEKQEKEEKERQEKERKEKERQEKERQEKEKQEKEKQEKENSDKIIYPFEQKLKDLEEMGFLDRKKNISMLIKYRGEMQVAIQELLNI